METNASSPLTKLTVSVGTLVDEHVNVMRVRWQCRCGGEFAHMGTLHKIIPSMSNMAQRGYQMVTYPHQCSNCMIIVDNTTQFPTFVAVGDPK